MVLIWSIQPKRFQLGGLNKIRVFWPVNKIKPRNVLASEVFITLKDTFPQFFLNKVPQVIIKKIDVNENFSLSWQKHNSKGENTDELNADVRAIDGKIVRVNFDTDKRVWRYKISPIYARSIL